MKRLIAFCCFLFPVFVHAEEISPLRSVVLEQNEVFQTTRVDISSFTSRLTIKIQRPTSDRPTSITDWPATSSLVVNIVFVVDGVEYKASGIATGGIREDVNGNEAPEYILSYGPPVVMRNGVPMRIGETARNEVSGYLSVQATRGPVKTEILVAETEEGPAPQFIDHHSVAFDAATDAIEISGDNVLSLTHTSAGSDRAVFAGVGDSDGTPQTITGVTYAGTAMTEMWDIAGLAFTRGGGYRLHNQSTTAGATVTSTLAGSVGEHVLSVLSMTGVDQTTVVGTPVSDGTPTVAPSVTVGSVGADDLVVDFVYFSGNGGTDSEANCNPGANQTERTQAAFDGGSFSVFGGISTQAGSDGGAMSWSTVAGGSAFGNTLGAVNFIASAAAASVVPHRRRIIVVE